jgi:hypothetical protein
MMKTKCLIFPSPAGILVEGAEVVVGDGIDEDDSGGKEEEVAPGEQEEGHIATQTMINVETSPNIVGLFLNES